MNHGYVPGTSFVSLQVIRDGAPRLVRTVPLPTGATIDTAVVHVYHIPGTWYVWYSFVFFHRYAFSVRRLLCPRDRLQENELQPVRAV